MNRAMWLVATLVACVSAEVPEPVEVSPVGEVTVPEPGPPTRGWRRMDIEQLDASIRRVTGGIGWDDARGASQFEALARTLGVPDFVDATIEDLSPSLLFQKFLDDAANDVCHDLLVRERNAAPDGRVLAAGVSLDDGLQDDPEAVRAAIAAAVKRFHGRTLAVTAPELEPWTFLFDSATRVAGDPEVAWHTICVGLLTHPDFYTY